MRLQFFDEVNLIVLKLHHAQVSIPISSEEEARTFYLGILGLLEVPKPKSLEGRGGFWAELGDLQIHFGVEDGVDQRATRSHLAYEVSDLEGWIKRFSELGIEIFRGIPIPGFTRIELRDPFGNRLEFLQRQMT